jgi:hypothetical protein
MLIRQQPSLILHVQKKYDQAGWKVFEDANAWFALREMFINILQHLSLTMTYIVIDALDECVKDLPKLLRLIIEQSAVSPHVKWIVSSRDWPQIEQQLREAKYTTKLSLERNANFVSKAVAIYIEHKVCQLAKHQSYSAETRDAVFKHLSCNAEGTFLWVALVCEHLEKIRRWNTIKKLSEFPPGLNPLYTLMLEQIRQTDIAHLCEDLLATMTVVYRPIALAELTSLGDMLIDISSDEQAVIEVVRLCGSFLSIRNSTIYFVHQSAKDFLRNYAGNMIFPRGQGAVHHTISIGSLHMLTNTLRRDIYGLQAPGYSIEQVRRPVPDPLAAARYACIYWVDHLSNWILAGHTNPLNDLDHWGDIQAFIRETYLYWLEALSLCRSMSEGVLSIARLFSLLQVIMTL